MPLPRKSRTDRQFAASVRAATRPAAATATDRVTRRRLAEWRAALKASRATPVLLVGVENGAKRGTVVCAIDEAKVDRQLLCWFLRNALRKLEEGGEL